MRSARPDLYRAGVFRKYLLVVTDGENTAGRSPDDVAREIFRKSEGAVQTYFVAFDTSPEKFAFLKEAGGDVIGAGSGAELRTALDGIYQGKILAEAVDAGEREPANKLTTSVCKETVVIVQKFWSAFVAQLNKIANISGKPIPIAQMQYEHDRAVEQLKEGRNGLEQYRGLVERVTRQVSANRSHVQKLEAETKAYLKAGDRATAAKFALELQKAKAELAANEQQLQMHETAYGNNLKKIKHANEKLIELREKITKYDAELKMSAAEAEIAEARRELRHEPDDRLRPDRAGDPAEDRPESRQGPRRGGPVREGHRRDSGGRADAGGDGRAGAHAASRSSSGSSRPKRRRSHRQPRISARQHRQSDRTELESDRGRQGRRSTI